jgi:SEC-C motif domain protein
MSKQKQFFECPCRARETVSEAYADCCAPWHQGFEQGLHAPTPEALMRSRYSAYALAQGRYFQQANHAAGSAMLAYLTHTWHPGTAPDGLTLEPLQWIGLEIVASLAAGEAGIVHFRAYYRVNGQATTLEERSRFVRVGGAWQYIDALPDEAESSD